MMTLQDRMELAEWDFCNQLDAEGPVVIHDQTFTRSLITRTLARSYYDSALLDFMRKQGIDVDSE